MNHIITPQGGKPLTTTDMPTAVGKTILEQLGGQRFIAMTGARDFVYLYNMLQFDLPSGFAIRGMNRVQIELTPADTYDMRFYRTGPGHAFVLLSSSERVYANRLQDLFTLHSGLDTHL